MDHHNSFVNVFHSQPQNIKYVEQKPSSSHRYKDIMAMVIKNGNPAHNIIISGNIFNGNFTGGYLGSKDLLEERMGDLKLDILHKNGPIIKLTGLRKILGFDTNNKKMNNKWNIPSSSDDDNLNKIIIIN